jgi:hypothetical protein
VEILGRIFICVYVPVCVRACVRVCDFEGVCSYFQCFFIQFYSTNVLGWSSNRPLQKVLWVKGLRTQLSKFKTKPEHCRTVIPPGTYSKRRCRSFLMIHT